MVSRLVVAPVLALALAVLPQVSRPPLAAAADGPPQATGSSYVSAAVLTACLGAVQSCPLFIRGRDLPAPPAGGAMVVLDHGSPCFDPSTGAPGVGVFGSTDCVPFALLVPAARAFVTGYRSSHGPGTPPLVLVLGVSNSLTGSDPQVGGVLDESRMAADGAALYRDLVAPVAAAAAGTPVVVWGGIDAEQADDGNWAGPGPTRALVDAYAAATGVTTPSCAPAGPGMLADFGTAAPGHGGWAPDDVWHVVAGTTVSCVVPEIYVSENADQWGGLQLWAQGRGLPALTPVAVMSDGGDTWALPAADAWSALGAALGHAPGMVTVMAALGDAAATGATSRAAGVPAAVAVDPGGVGEAARHAADANRAEPVTVPPPPAVVLSIVRAVHSLTTALAGLP